MQEKFKEQFGKWRKALKDTAVGPLLIAEEVVKFAEVWDPKENDGRKYSGALEDALGDGKGLRFFRIRAKAAQDLAPHRAAQIFEHTAAIWLTAKAQNGVLAAAVKECAIAYNQNHRCPLTQAQVVRVTREVLGHKPRQRISTEIAKDLEIERLRQALAEREAELADLRAKFEEKGAQALQIE